MLRKKISISTNWKINTLKTPLLIEDDPKNKVKAVNSKFPPPLSSKKTDAILARLSQASKELSDPIVTSISKTRKDPFRILIATILSLRTKDEMTYKASQRLFARADTPAQILAIPLVELEQLIFSVGFYKRKAQTIREICKRLIEEYKGRVPDSLDELLSFKGVGRKTANLVITKGFDKPGICVDVHVARITQRIGIVPIKGVKEKKLIFQDADRVEMTLRKILPKKWWIPINDILVRWGQNICTPISPKCSQCVINESCLKIGVQKHR